MMVKLDYQLKGNSNDWVIWMGLWEHFQRELTERRNLVLRVSNNIHWVTPVLKIKKKSIACLSGILPNECIYC